MQKWFRSTNTKAKVTVYYQDLRAIESSAGSILECNQTLTSKDLMVECSSGASSNINLESDKVSVSASSGATVQTKGKAKNIKCSASSGASISAQDVISNTAEAEASSGASVNVYASEKLVANASSGGSVRYKGNPKQKKTDVGTYSGGSVSAY